jgi:hypothetical protein
MEPRSFLNDPRHWRERAEEARSRADQKPNLNPEMRCCALLTIMKFLPSALKPEPRAIH